MAAEIAVDSITIVLRDEATGEPLMAAVDNLRAKGIAVALEAASEHVGAVALAEKAAASARDQGTSAIVAAGGDGTLNEVINGAYRPNLNYTYGVGVVPLGTANDFARQCRIPLDDPQDALDAVARGRRAWIDLGRMNGRFFANIALGGFAAEVSSETSSTLKKMLGPSAYLVHGLASMGDLAPRHMKIMASGQHWEGNAFLVVVGNGGVSGGITQLSKCTLINDGKLDVCLLPDVPLQRLIAIGEWVMRGGELSAAEEVVYFQAEWLDIESESLQVNLDGQPFSGDKLHFDVVERCMPFFMPLEGEKPAFLL